MIVASPDQLVTLETELERVVDRLNSMSLQRAATATESCYAVAEEMLAQTRLLDGQVPAKVTLPRLEPHGLGSLLAVLGRDFLEAAKATPLSDVQPVTDRLIELRRSLP